MKTSNILFTLSGLLFMVAFGLFWEHYNWGVNEVLEPTEKIMLVVGIILIIFGLFKASDELRNGVSIYSIPYTIAKYSGLGAILLIIPTIF